MSEEAVPLAPVPALDANVRPRIGLRRRLEAWQHAAAVGAVLAVAAFFRLGGLMHELPYTYEVDAFLTVEPVAAALQDTFIRIYDHPEKYSLYGSLYPVAVWLVAAPLALLRALTGQFSPAQWATGSLPIMSLIGTTGLIGVARLVSALCGVLTVGLLYAMGRRLVDGQTGLLAIILFTFTPVAVYFGPAVKEVGLLLLLANAALYCLMSYALTPQPSRYYLGCLLAGLAASTQQTGALYAMAMVGGVIAFDLWQRREIVPGRWNIGVLLLAAGVFLGNPNLIFRTGPTLRRLAWLLGMYGRDTTAIYSSGYQQLVQFLPMLTGTLVFLTAIVGLGVALYQRRVPIIVGSAPAVAVVALALTTRGRIVSYYLLVATPWMCLLAALAIRAAAGANLWRRPLDAMARRRGWSERWLRNAAIVVLTVIVGAKPFAASVEALRSRLGDTPVTLLAKWLERNLPLRVYVSADLMFPVLMSGWGHFDSPPRVRRLPGPFFAISEASFEWYAQKRVRFLGYAPNILPNMALDRDSIAKYLAFTEELRRRWVMVFKAGGYEFYGEPIARIDAELMRVVPTPLAGPPRLPSEFTVVPPPFRGSGPYNMPPVYLGGVFGDDKDARTSTTVLYENGVPLGPSQGAFEEAGYSHGLYAHWRDEGIYFTTSDNTDPNVNGRSYAVSLQDGGVVLQPGWEMRYPWPLPAGTYRILVRARPASDKAGRMRVGFDGAPPTEFPVENPGWQIFEVPLHAAEPQGTPLVIVNPSSEPVWVDYIERAPAS